MSRNSSESCVRTSSSFKKEYPWQYNHIGGAMLDCHLILGYWWEITKLPLYLTCRAWK